MANKKLKSQGTIKRLIDAMQGRRYEDNVFAPTALINLIERINTCLPKHSLILADFDSFIMPIGGIQGKNAPLVTHKLKNPEDWISHDNYLIDRGHADICFPTDFYFLQHAYKHLTGKQGEVYKNRDFMEQFSLDSWGMTRNGFNPMKEEYFNTTFFTTDVRACYS